MKKENISKAKHENIDELTGLRGLAALLILLNHILLLVPYLRKTSVNPFLSHLGLVGMSLFFTLSGFVIYYNYAERICNDPKNAIKKFLVARFARLYPLYFVFILGSFVLNLFLSKFELKVFAANLMSLPTFLLGVQSWVYGYVNGFPLIHLQDFANISWSISTEVALYMFFIPLAFVRLGSWKKVLYLFIAVLVMRSIYVYLCYFGVNGKSLGWCIDSQIPPQHGYLAWIWLVFHSPYGRFFEFVVGCLSAKFFLIGNYNYQRKFKYVAIGALFFLGLNLTDIIAFELSNHLLIPLSIMVFVFSLVQCRSKILRSKLLIFIGEISYSTYLLHIIVVQFLSYSGHDTFTIAVRIILFFMVTYLIAYYSYRYIEDPARRILRSRFS